MERTSVHGREDSIRLRRMLGLAVRVASAVLIVRGALRLLGHDGEAAPQDERHKSYHRAHQQDEILHRLKEIHCT